MIIDSGKESISLLESCLEEFDEIEVVGKTTGYRAGIQLSKKKIPDVVFLDVELPEVSWTEVAESIKHNATWTKVILTSRNYNHAYEALAIEPFDYILKPFNRKELSAVIERYKTFSRCEEADRKITLLMQTGKAIPKIRLPIYEGTLFVTSDDIMMLKAELNYSRIYKINQKEETVLLNMSSVATLLDSQYIFKTSRSSYINMRYLKTIEKKTLTCTLEYNDYLLETRISKTYLRMLEKLNLKTP